MSVSSSFFRSYVKALTPDSLLKIYREIRTVFSRIRYKLENDERKESLLCPNGQEILFFASRARGGGRYQQLKTDIDYLSNPARIEYRRTKEPETVAWLNQMPEGKVLWDIGANVGTYSLYAAQQKGMRVLAFEPHYANFFALNENIRLSQATSLIQAYCTAFDSKEGLSGFHAPHTSIGGSGSNLGSPVDHRDIGFNAQFVQGGLGISVDKFTDLFNPFLPTAIKIDVDGLELEILQGATSLLKDSELQFLSIELNDGLEKKRDKAVQILNDSGFVPVNKFLTEKKRIDEPGLSNSNSQNYNYHFERA